MSTRAKREGDGENYQLVVFSLAAIQEITQYNPKYIEDMRDVFDKCQEVEAKRLKFFKDEM